MKSSKGAEFERKLSKRLSLWWTHGERDDVFWRSQQSGGRATQRRKKGVATANQEGDLQAMDAIGQPLVDKICIEAKCGYGDFNLEKLLSGKQKESTFERFVAQCRREVEGSSRTWWLVVKQDLRRELIIMPGLAFMALVRKKKEKAPDRISVTLGDETCTIMRLDDFLGIVGPEDFME